MRKIAVCGKGGVGKSFIVYGIAKAFANRGKKVLVVDSDESNQTLYRLLGFNEPPSAFMDFLGGKKSVQQSIIKRFQSADKETKINVIEKETFSIDEIPNEFIKKDGNIGLVSIGKIKEPMEGCACPMGVVSREFLEKIELNENEIIIVDTEAGIEHFGRGIEKGIDTVIAVAEPYLDSIEVAEKAISISEKMGKNTYLIMNKISKEMEGKMREITEKRGLSVLGWVHFSPEIYVSAIEGGIPEKSEAFREIEEFLDKIMEEFKFKPIGYIKTEATEIPRHWTVSQVEGEIVIEPKYKLGLKDIKVGDKIVVIFVFHKSPPFSEEKLIQKPPHLNETKGVFSTCSPHRPNPLGLSVLEVLDIRENIIRVKRLDMYDGTPVLDIKPYIEYKSSGE
ncbi:MAG: tRNA (N6-threonylcarbamoyladenosine(37)-N6)-methyltransferase TrmO [Thermodesulfovibrio sp.]|nr:tRNA (N6-threonylcarbamoyladenosine(37)-N6)-methyltransferase TrmO [Thermodesulfovibrio sp.]MDW7999310.1 tRNA (N6-threonylcarbamoyladenosine(37)-N6)-methyltransferase TrmO [Thermodesulfovibrio sp.]